MRRNESHTKLRYIQIHKIRKQNKQDINNNISCLGVISDVQNFTPTMYRKTIEQIDKHSVYSQTCNY